MSIEDYLLDKERLGGLMVAITGSASCMGPEMCELTGSTVTTSMMFDSSALPRDDRKRLLGCNMFVNPCPVVLHGRGAPVSYQPMRATSIEWAPTPEEIAAADKTLPPCTQVDKDDIQALAEQSPVGRMSSLKVLSVSTSSTTSPAGLITCSATLVTSAGEKKMKYYLSRGPEGLLIRGNWSE
jgi:hypothetical protein